MNMKSSTLLFQCLLRSVIPLIRFTKYGSELRKVNCYIVASREREEDLFEGKYNMQLISKHTLRRYSQCNLSSFKLTIMPMYN